MHGFSQTMVSACLRPLCNQKLATSLRPTVLVTLWPVFTCDHFATKIWRHPCDKKPQSRYDQCSLCDQRLVTNGRQPIAAVMVTEWSLTKIIPLSVRVVSDWSQALNMVLVTRFLLQQLLPPCNQHGCWPVNDCSTTVHKVVTEGLQAIVSILGEGAGKAHVCNMYNTRACRPLQEQLEISVTCCNKWGRWLLGPIYCCQNWLNGHIEVAVMVSEVVVAGAGCRLLVLVVVVVVLVVVVVVVTTPPLSWENWIMMLVGWSSSEVAL